MFMKENPHRKKNWGAIWRWKQNTSFGKDKIRKKTEKWHFVRETPTITVLKYTSILRNNLRKTDF